MRLHRDADRAGCRRSLSSSRTLPSSRAGGRLGCRSRARHGTARAAAGRARGAPELPLEPMLGCFGVAPAGGQAISTATSRPHGGNMDYRGFAPGRDRLLPGRSSRARCFHVGDGHAIQGDGEIVGTGDRDLVRCRSSPSACIKGKQHRLAARRERRRDHRRSATPARSTRRSSTPPPRWSAGSRTTTASTPAPPHLLGQCIRYDIGNVFDPAYTVVAKLEKRLLP